MAAQGHLSEAISNYMRAIEITEGLVQQEGRRELCDALARWYNCRGLALVAQGHLPEAISDYARAMEITEGLVEREGRRELRSDLAHWYNNRANLLVDQGHLAEAIADYGRAIQIREELVEREGRHELRSDLWMSLFNRALARRRTREWQQASADIERGSALLCALVEDGQRHVLGSLLKTLGFRCQYAKKLGDPPKAAEAANEAMRWFLEEVEQDRTTEPLLKAAAGFAEGVRGNRKFLSKHGLDESLWRRFQSSLDTPGGGSSPVEA